MIDLKTFTSIPRQRGAAPIEMPILPAWVDKECFRRGKAQWEALAPFMNDEGSTEINVTSSNQGNMERFKNAVAFVRNLYHEPFISPIGEEVPVTKEMIVWLDEYWMQCCMYPRQEERLAIEAEVARYFNDGKKFTLGRVFSMKADTALKEEQEKGSGLN